MLLDMVSWQLRGPRLVQCSWFIGEYSRMDWFCSKFIYISQPVVPSQWLFLLFLVCGGDTKYSERTDSGREKCLPPVMELGFYFYEPSSASISIMSPTLFKPTWTGQIWLFEIISASANKYIGRCGGQTFSALLFVIPKEKQPNCGGSTNRGYGLNSPVFES